MSSETPDRRELDSTGIGTPPRRMFTCAICGAECVATNTEAESNQEFLTSGITIDSPDDKLISACDDCYEIVMRLAREQGLLADTSAPTGVGDGVAQRNTPPQETGEAGI